MFSIEEKAYLRKNWKKVLDILIEDKNAYELVKYKEYIEQAREEILDATWEEFQEFKRRKRTEESLILEKRD